MKENRYYNRELSWLSFNERVLQEAQSSELPVMERIKFIAIWSSNLDEFYRVRVAKLRSLMSLKKKTKKQLDFSPKALLQQITDKVSKQQKIMGHILHKEIMPALKKQQVFFEINPTFNLTQVQKLTEYFEERIKAILKYHFLDDQAEIFLANNQLYLLVILEDKKTTSIKKYALIEIPSDCLPRFYQLETYNKTHIIYLDDIIRLKLPNIFADYNVLGSYAIKLSRDADLNLGDEFEGDLAKKIEKSLQKRENGLPARFLYDETMPKDILAMLKEKLKLNKYDLIPGSKYHNLKDLFQFPNPNNCLPSYKPSPTVPHPILEKAPSILQVIQKQDAILHFPYQSFQPVIQLVKEAAIDPAVSNIYLTMYRVGKDSAIAKALQEASKNGKEVTVFIEVKARFDEAANLYWSKKLTRAGVKVLLSIPGIKVHTKLCLIIRKEGDKKARYAYVATGNFNENTAKLYCDHGLMTAHEGITKEIHQVFQILHGNPLAKKFKHLLVAPNHMRKAFTKLIRYEVQKAKEGKIARMILKMNSLEDPQIIEELYKASQAGVKIQLIIRGICCLVPGVKNLSENIKVISIIGRFLEHARVYYFHHSGAGKTYIASADWMNRNLSRRIEVGVPIYDQHIKDEIMHILQLQCKDNVKARQINITQSNPYKLNKSKTKIDAQLSTFDWLKDKGQ